MRLLVILSLMVLPLASQALTVMNQTHSTIHFAASSLLCQGDKTLELPAGKNRVYEIKASLPLCHEFKILPGKTSKNIKMTEALVYDVVAAVIDDENVEAYTCNSVARDANITFYLNESGYLRCNYSSQEEGL